MENMNIYELREIDNIYKEVTNNQIKSKISVKDKLTLIQIISGRNIKVKKPKTMVIPMMMTTKNFNEENLPNWMRR